MITVFSIKDVIGKQESLVNQGTKSGLGEQKKGETARENTSFKKLGNKGKKRNKAVAKWRYLNTKDFLCHGISSNILKSWCEGTGLKTHTGRGSRNLPDDMASVKKEISVPISTASLSCF